MSARDLTSLARSVADDKLPVIRDRDAWRPISLELDLWHNSQLPQNPRRQIKFIFRNIGQESSHYVGRDRATAGLDDGEKYGRAGLQYHHKIPCLTVGQPSQPETIGDGGGPVHTPPLNSIAAVCKARCHENTVIVIVIVIITTIIIIILFIGIFSIFIIFVNAINTVNNEQRPVAMIT
ncbi:hypothetical protein F4824DRAFT_503278 [Ustulina deusta]|nr:hypothetical protein F4824DRAFT_503278 [Ustulina deusta]